MASSAQRSPEDLSEEERERLRMAHHRLRNASQALEAFTAPKRLRGRWDPLPVPAEAMDAAYQELDQAYRAVWRLHGDLLGRHPPDAPER